MNSMLSIHAAIEQAKTEWYEANSPKVIAKKTKDLLDSQRQQVLMQLLGFEKDSWRSHVWEVDHCNGRNGNSKVGATTKQIVSEVLDDWVQEHREEFDKYLTTQIKTEFKKELKSQLGFMLRKTIASMLEAAMTETAERLLKDELKDLTYKAALKLIDKDPS